MVWRGTRQDAGGTLLHPATAEKLSAASQAAGAVAADWAFVL